jgi:hypothetical protein
VAAAIVSAGEGEEMIEVVDFEWHEVGSFLG